MVKPVDPPQPPQLPYHWNWSNGGAMGPNAVLMQGSSYPFGGVHVYFEDTPPAQRELVLGKLLKTLNDTLDQGQQQTGYDMNYYTAKNAVKFGGKIARSIWDQPCYIESDMAHPPTLYLTNGLGFSQVYEPSKDDTESQDWLTVPAPNIVQASTPTTIEAPQVNEELPPQS